MKTILSIFLVIPFLTCGQTLTERSRLTLSTESGDEVILYVAAECDHCYYYLPTCLRLASTQGSLETSFVAWNDEETFKPAGGVLHFLVEWGLKPGVETEVREIIRSRFDSLAVVMGPALVQADNRESVLEGADKLSIVLARGLRNTPAFPTTPGAKMALSFRFTENEIGDFLYYVKYPNKSKTNLRVAYSYSVITSSGQERDSKTVLRLPFSEILESLK
jgi:hypothetical protein